ncbi:murein hydrolase activator EnvC family protein [Bartonella sp. JB63]|uniref:murein hydrolase activator EnvC family protein n=1 Tax=unclassified Bartonella TaxID=2645622 RepID=UPI0009C232FE|nr:Septal ring factor EnvC, activator of murein hydrolases AmiA and AmiB [Bartonella sp. JB15]AQX29626.1 Septal ring factor EnvC, activator of murein hydrolases AmiA and AmiB [Bartonella sp. JB63]
MGMGISILHAEDIDSREVVRKTLQDIRNNISVSSEYIALLIQKVDRLKKDQRTLTDKLIKVAKIERNFANNVIEREKKLKQLLEQQMQVYQNLKNRRAEFAEILAILARAGLKLPPALIARPKDVLASIRSSILLGAVIPDMLEKTQDLTKSLKKLTDLNRVITTECANLKAKMQSQAEQLKHLEFLLGEKAKLQKRSEKELIMLRQKNITLIKKAQSLEELILELDHQAQSDSSLSEEMQKNLQLLERMDFKNKKGRLFLPVLGKKIQQFNNSSHVARFGEIIATEPAAVVVAPTDALVAFAGSFRSYGQLIILSVGNGYYIILIGMAKINVNQGQFVLSGEPIGMMGTQFLASTLALDIGKRTPMLYIEFRKHGRPVNPNPWWQTEQLKRNKNDS